METIKINGLNVRRLHDLNDEELKEVWYKNAKLREMAYNYRIEDARMFVDEYLNCFAENTIDYFIDTTYFETSYIKVLDLAGFLDGLESLENYGVMDIVAKTSQKDLIELVTFENEHIEVLSTETIEALDNDINKLIELINRQLIELIHEEYRICEDDEELQHYFVNFMLEWMIEGGTYYLDDNYILYQNKLESFK